MKLRFPYLFGRESGNVGIGQYVQISYVLIQIFSIISFQLNLKKHYFYVTFFLHSKVIALIEIVLVKEKFFQA